MRIIFDLVNCGLGNNGGSHTIVQSANALTILNHDVIIIDNSKNSYTWDELRTKHVIVKNSKDVPSADVVIATGYKTVSHVEGLPKRCGIKAHWIRGWETWQFPEDKIVGTILNTPLVKLVNGFGLQEKLKSYGFESYLVRPGNDLNLFTPMKTRETRPEIVLGGLYHSKHKTKRSDWAVAISRQLRKKYPMVRLFLFGATNLPVSVKVDHYVLQPTQHIKNIFFNTIDIWLATSELEGLHIVPQEAMLTECPVVTTDAPMAGTKDYIENEVTGLISKNDVFSFTNCVERLVKDGTLRMEIGRRGRQKILEMGNRVENMRNMVNTLEKLS
jgi:L-malate glycosyltransferase